MHHPTDRIAHTTAFVTPVVEHWLEREILLEVRQMVRATVKHNKIEMGDVLITDLTTSATSSPPSVTSTSAWFSASRVWRVCFTGGDIP